MRRNGLAAYRNSLSKSQNEFLAPTGVFMTGTPIACPAQSEDACSQAVAAQFGKNAATHNSAALRVMRSPYGICRRAGGGRPKQLPELRLASVFNPYRRHLGSVDGDVVEQGGIQNGIIMRAQCQADVNGFLHRNADVIDRMPRFAVHGNFAGEEIARPRQAHPIGNDRRSDAIDTRNCYAR